MSIILSPAGEALASVLPGASAGSAEVVGVFGTRNGALRMSSTNLGGCHQLVKHRHLIPEARKHGALSRLSPESHVTVEMEGGACPLARF